MQKIEQVAYSWHGLCCVVNTSHPEIVGSLLAVFFAAAVIAIPFLIRSAIRQRH